MKKRIAKFLALFSMLIIFGVIEDILAAHISGGLLITIMDSLPLIFLISVIFTIITEFIEERFDRGEGPIEHFVDVVIGKKRPKKKK